MIIQYCIMSFIFGYTGNKIFGRDKSIRMSIKVAILATMILATIDICTILI
ncbi:hypothetical protein [Clostridium beijerinckii]|jgi:hypothetical protein|uniref:hypothetical protein n=1 Tax=Clostridium beijerinckii TaxID=1520 RepID=UPI0013610D58|nr:hypothetical protein [Clostridium beijerinckii]MZK51896.1 hypothetical protein [Clostridium beijerinckii]MZK58513.1 hypothetical protein [Clostridium beijerinckii]MZK68861.1 hypothetical protein [Clostridium beijerinckii]MZK74232.1 hypothetical protein [Clostridium beijerinckii]MZK83933.1 hypothetical protein [Clostridium beijerinckii]